MRRTTKAPNLSLELEHLALREIRTEWHGINRALFGSSLRPPVFELTSSSAHHGRWIRRQRSMELSKELLIGHPWTAVIEVLKHETAHQFVEEILCVFDETPHGPTFQRVCIERGIDPRAAGLSDAPRAPEPVQGAQRIFSRIAKLLALAESQNEHEAHAAMAAAQRLMLKHNIDVAEKHYETTYSYRHLGEPTGRVSEAQRVLSGILTSHFFVEAIWIPVYRPLEGKRGKVLEICGTPENLEIAEYVHGFLFDTAARLWKEHREARGLASNRDRLKFHAGVMLGFNETMNRSRTQNREEGLVWQGDAGLSDYFRRRFPRTRTFSGSGSKPSRAYADGREAGRKIILHKPVTAGPSVEGRMLPA